MINVIDVIGLIVSSIVLGVCVTLLWVTLQPGAVIAWFIWRRWQFKRYGGLTTCHNNNLYGCRKHPIIYNDMCRIVRGGK